MIPSGDLPYILDGSSVAGRVNQRERTAGLEYETGDPYSGMLEEANRGALVNVTETARKVGFTLQTFITAPLYRDISDVSSPLCSRRERYAQRLWDVLFVGRYESVRRGASDLNYRVEMPVGGEQIVMIRAVFAGCGLEPNDVQPSLILMHPDEGPNSRRR